MASKRLGGERLRKLSGDHTILEGTMREELQKKNS
jgi:hypothetical protein